MKKLSCILLLLSTCVCFYSCTNKQITTQTLLEEIIQRDDLPQFPSPYYTCAQFSSYDRYSVAADKPGWFGNMDKNQFIRIETNENRREFVLFDTAGPGAVVRFWTTIAGYNGNGILRFYIDHEKEPVIEGDILKLISNGGLIDEGPLATSVSNTTPYLQRGHNLYFPIPYASHCKITYESPDILESSAPSGEGIFYNINYRTYNQGVSVKSFTKTDLIEHKPLIEQVNKKLAGNDWHTNPPTLSNKKITNTIQAGQTISEEIEGSQAIRKIELQLKAGSIEQALRSTVLEISFDGERTVWCPVGDFFGAGYKLSPFVTRYAEAKPDGTLLCYWVMPFKNNCQINLINLGEQPVEIQAEISYDAWSWTNRSMYFGASWHQLTDLDTGEDPFNEAGEDKYDVNYVTLTGEGVLVGTSVILFNTANAWWGEGDEKIYVDGETFPSHFGTGTEDYYGYAWGMPDAFSHPYIAQPDGSGNQQPGYVSNIRFRGLDAIPFKKSVQFDMEMWHWARTIMNYAPAAFWYGKPGIKTNIEPRPEEAKHPVMLHAPAKERVVHENGTNIEGEDMAPLYKTGFIGTQSIKGLGWSNDTQMMWTGSKPGDELTLLFFMKEEGTHKLKARLTQSHDYGIISMELNGKKIISSFDGYSKNVKSIAVPCGEQKLMKGENTLKVKILGKHPEAIDNFFGLDCLEFSN